VAGEREAANLTGAAIQYVKQDTLALLDAYRFAMTQHSPIDGEGIVADFVSVRHALGERGFHLPLAGILERGDRLCWREEVHRHITSTTQRGLKLF
jgi:hypothetical protein